MDETWLDYMPDFDQLLQDAGLDFNSLTNDMTSGDDLTSLFGGVPDSDGTNWPQGFPDEIPSEWPVGFGNPTGTGDGSGGWGDLASLAGPGSSLLRFLTQGNGPGGGSGSGSPWEFLTRLLGGDGGGGILSNPMLIPALTAAFKQWNDAGKIKDSMEKYADQADPFGKERGFYQDKLRGLTENPEEYLKNDPMYQSILKMAIGPAQSKLRSKGYGNSGNMLSELTTIGGDVTNKYMGEMMDRWGKFGGAQFGPESAAQLRARGLEASVNSQNSALNSLFYPFLATAYNKPGTAPNGGNNNNGNNNAPFDLSNIFRLFPNLPGNYPYPSSGGDDENSVPSPANNGSGEDNINDRWYP